MAIYWIKPGDGKHPVRCKHARALIVAQRIEKQGLTTWYVARWYCPDCESIWEHKTFVNVDGQYDDNRRK